MNQGKDSPLAPLVAISRRYGADPEWVLAGGGNTSFKTADRLFVKASGFPLGAIDRSGFCEMERAKLDAIWEKRYPADTAAREDAALADLMAARAPGETKRPSVETLLHGFFPQAYVVHTHPAAVNGLTCGRDGESAFRRLFGDEGIWVPFVDPGYTLAKTVRGIFEEFRAKKGRAPSIMLMQNHGLLVAGETPADIEAISASISARLDAEIALSEGARPDQRSEAVDASAASDFFTALEGLAGEHSFVFHRADRMILGFSASPASFEPISLPYSPDHIVYAGHEYLRVDGAANLDAAWADFRKRNGYSPRVVLARDLGAFAIGAASRPDESAAARMAAERVLDLFVDSCKVATYTKAFGGPRFMSPEAVAFIRNWEVEKYRSSLAAR
ncbi:MAG TPA: class II aldolase/adducin family protein [Rectinemataceae bacterium]|nr:class II aldolase/adducin family protein [Rectinemataceae bacterium]